MSTGEIASMMELDRLAAGRYEVAFLKGDDQAPRGRHPGGDALLASRRASSARCIVLLDTHNAPVGGGHHAAVAQRLVPQGTATPLAAADSGAGPA